MTKYKAKRNKKHVTISFTPERIHKSKKKENLSAKHEKKTRTPQSIFRSISVIKEYVNNNDFDYFVTFEFSPIYARSRSSEELVDSFVQYIQNVKKRKTEYRNMQYILVPEPYKDRRCKWHIHALMRGLPTSELSAWVERKGKKTAYIRAEIKMGNEIYTLPMFENHVGICMVQPIHDIKKATNYLCKSLYNADDYRTTGRQLYYTSGSLQKDEFITEGFATVEMMDKAKNMADKKKYHRDANDPNGTIFGVSYEFNATDLQTVNETLHKVGIF